MCPSVRLMLSAHRKPTRLHIHTNNSMFSVCVCVWSCVHLYCSNLGPVFIHPPRWAYTHSFLQCVYTPEPYTHSIQIKTFTLFSSSPPSLFVTGTSPSTLMQYLYINSHRLPSTMTSVLLFEQLRVVVTGSNEAKLIIHGVSRMVGLGVGACVPSCPPKLFNKYKQTHSPTHRLKPSIETLPENLTW